MKFKICLLLLLLMTFSITTLAQTNKTADDKNKESKVDIQHPHKAAKNSPIDLMTVWQKYDELKDEKNRDFYENLILHKFPNTKYDETILFNQIIRFEEEANKRKLPEDISKNQNQLLKKAQKTEFQKINERCWSFIKRQTHFDEANFGYIYFDLLKRIGKTQEVTDNQLKFLIQGSLQYTRSNRININSEIARILIEVKTLRPKSEISKTAEKYARDGIDEAENKIRLFKPDESTGLAKSLRGQALNALGYVLLQEGKLDEAEQVLFKAKQIEIGKAERFFVTAMREDTNYNLARLYTIKKDYEKAEEFYLTDALDDEFTKKRFAKFYEERFGRKAGFDEYYNEIKQKIKIKSRERIIATRIQPPQAVTPFLLTTIDNKTISFDDLKGKVLVINIWGTWCKPCVIEMPQLQQLYKKYQNDKAVAIITMDMNDELETVKKFIAAKKYEFPVLLGDSYRRSIIFDGSTAFPTTLFIDKQGKLAFVKVGDTDNLVEEYEWRIEVLKQDH